jgi:phospholipase/lecithinase/hemolysin
MDNLGHLTTLHNKLLQEKVSSYQIKYPQIKMIQLNAHDFMKKIQDDPKQFAISNTSEACFAKLSFSGTKSDLCQNPNDYLFYDLAHPTSRIHCFVGHHIHEVLFNEGLTSLEPKSSEAIYDYCVKESERILMP